MAFAHRAPLLLVPGREVGTNAGRRRIHLLENRRRLFWAGFNVHRAGTCGHVLLMRRGFDRVVLSFGGDGPMFEAADGRYPNDSYLGEVAASEKVEEPPQYVPPPPISEEDICIRDKVESLLYTLERILPGRLDGDNVQTLCSRLCTTVECQNPVACFRGSDKCSEWLRALMQVQASISLHELYYENDAEDPEKRRIYTVWTVSFLEHVRGDPIEISSESEPNQMSGETMLEMEKSGLVSRISSTWYVLQEDDGASFTKAKDSLHHLLQRTF